MASERVKVHAAIILALSLFGLAWFHNSNTLGVHRSLHYTIEDFEDQEYFDDGNFRVVSFGTSRAYGSGLPHPESQSYTGLLGGTNLAIRASDARYPAMCAKSMVKDAIYDVIIIEYMPHMYDATKGAMLRLGERMRQRFPDSLIIYIDMWTIHQFSIQHKGAMPAMEEYHQAIAGTENEHLSFSLAADMAMMREAVQKEPINASVLQYPVPEAANYKEAIQIMHPYYKRDHTHWSKFGMQWLKREIVKIIRTEQHVRSDAVQEWESNDECLSWYQDSSSESIKKSLHTNMPMVPFAKNGGKFALEASNPDFNFIRITREDNTNSTKPPQPRHVYLSYMVSGPMDDFYGGAKFELHPNHPTAEASATVEVSTLETWFPHPWHVINHKYIGRAEGRKETYLTIEGNRTGLATSTFRAIGINIVSEAPLGQFGGEDLRGWY
mmetsp:Transcript_8197/g.11914  ORF Transcript_8197/g.11914 Transcript_8197/m.11914 type:complete len:439 (+) Transcript_8197:51-1367(+)